MRLFEPHPDLGLGSDTLKLWVEDVLREYGLSVEDDLYGATTDAGSDVKRLATVLFDRTCATRPSSAHLQKQVRLSPSMINFLHDLA